MTRHQAAPIQGPERIGDVVSRWLIGVSAFGLCRDCWCRQDLSEGHRCIQSGCNGLIVRVRSR